MSKPSEGGKSGRHADNSAEYLKDAKNKFPNGFDESAKYHYTTLRTQNKNKSFKPGTLDHYLLFTFFPAEKAKTDAAAKASKSPSKNSAQGNPSASGNAAPPHSADSPASSSSSADEEDESVRQVEAEPAASSSKSAKELEVEKRAAADDAPAPSLSDVVANHNQRPVVDMDADALLGHGQPDVDTPENNAKIVDEVNAREAQKVNANSFPTLNRITEALLKAARARKSKEQAKAALNRENYKRFKKACMDSFNDSKDV